MAASVANENSNDSNNAANAAPSTKSDSTSGSTPNFPPPKTDKPRPHVCGTCSRSFARLEHLKRHERSHTKEKPFECPQCNRCFARRDLLLRHQQKLHQSGAPSTRPRTGRRESTSGVGQSGGRVRKNSVASMAGSGVGGASNGMRPRANTISHIDGAQLQFLQSHASMGGRTTAAPGHSHHSSLGGSTAFDFPGMSRAPGHHGNVNGLPKIDTQLGMGMGGGLRTAPIGGGFHDFGDLDQLFTSPNGSTINPAQLHFSGPFSAHPSSTFQPFPGAPPLEDDEHNMDWLGGMDKHMMFQSHEHAVDGSSPSAISTTSQSTFNDVMLDGSNNSMQASSAGWQNTSMAPTLMNHTQFSQDPMYMDMNSAFSTVSPKEMHDQGMTNDFSNANDFNITTPPAMPVMSPSMGVPGMPNQYFQPPMSIHQSDSNSISSSSMNGSARHSSVTSVSTDSITDATRQALLVGLSHPVSLGFGSRSADPMPQLPSTPDLQRFVTSYITYFHPHIPFVHVPTLSFDNPTYTTHIQANSGAYGHDNIAGGGGCLILAMAAIGALYEYQHETARSLYEAAKKLIHVFLEERRKLGCSDAINASHHGGASHHKAPLWLVQAMLLNLIYGHNCGDQTIANVSSVQCAALVSLLNDAGLTKPEHDEDSIAQLAHVSLDGDMEMNSPGMGGESRARYGNFNEDLHSQWLKWKTQEERKRTYFSVFMLSSILIIAFNQQPRILNSEIRLDLPCGEDLWAADTAEAWAAMGGANAERPLSFADALGYLLSASQRQPYPGSHSPCIPANDGSIGLPHADLPESEIQPSTFGCHILINALHVYIWETHQRHGGRRWKAQETEAMHAQIEPALNAWQAAWKANPRHRLDRAADPVFGALAMDSIPLLDLAYVRLFINLSNTKDACWRRDFSAMVEAITRATDPASEQEDSASMNGADSGPGSHPNQSPGPMSFSSPGGAADLNGIADPMSGMHHSSQSPDANMGMNLPMSQVQPKKSERLLRHAAFYAADSLSMSAKLNTTFADNHAARKLPLQAAVCVFDCVQVLAEWAISMQERLGPYANIILGNENTDLLNQIPGMLLLEEEDIKLLDRLGEIVNSLEMKMALGGGLEGNQQNDLAGPDASGYAAKLLLVTGYMFKSVGVWPVTHIMYRALQQHAIHMSRRAEASIRGLPPPPPPDNITMS